MYDIVIVGAGIVGSFTACELAKLGYRVCILDKHPSAGNKSCCTGIVSNECMKLLPVADSIIQQKAHSARIYSPAGNFIRIERDSTQAYILDRPKLDRWMASQAQTCGVEFEFSTLVESVNPHKEGIVVTCQHGQQHFDLRADAAIIASGFPGSLTSQLGLDKVSYYARGAQSEVSCHNLDETEIYCGNEIAPGFFAWLVPIGDSRAKAGLLSRHNPGKYMPLFLNWLVKQGKVPPAEFQINYGNIPLKPLSRTYGNRFVVIGDAAGQAKPTTGGGIYFGLLSAREAVAVLDEAFRYDNLTTKQLVQYQKRWRRILGQELDIDYWAHRFYQKLDDRQICHVFDIIERHGIHESFLASPDISFDWHGKIITEAIKHRSLQRSLEELSRYTPDHPKQQI